jgi:HK97 gp10 family phage protein
MMVQVRGLVELRKAFKDFGVDATKRQRRAIKLTATAYQGDVQTEAPYITGTLRRSIHVEMVSDSTALVGSNLEYAAPVEYGTRYRAPKPYFRPPLDLNKAKYRRIFLEEMSR